MRVGRQSDPSRACPCGSTSALGPAHPVESWFLFELDLAYRVEIKVNAAETLREQSIRAGQYADLSDGTARVFLRENIDRFPADRGQLENKQRGIEVPRSALVDVDRAPVVRPYTRDSLRN